MDKIFWELKAVFDRCSLSDTLSYIKWLNSDFTLYKQSREFDIYHHNTNAHIELAILREGSKPHFHKEEKVFYFFITGALLTLGALNTEGKAIYEQLEVSSGCYIPILPCMIHAVEPTEQGQTVLLLMYNPDTQRKRTDSAYPNDTFFV